MFDTIRKNGFLEAIREKIRYELGIQRLEEEVASLRYILDTCVDITKIGPTIDKELRQIQIDNTKLLGEFDEFCRNHNIVYWADFGTLLGAVRHGGFIPWDDDVDVMMPRSEMNRLISDYGDELRRIGYDFRPCDIHELRSWVISRNENGVRSYIDIFAAEEVAIAADEMDHLRDVTVAYRDFFWKNRNKSSDVLSKEKERLLAQLMKGENEYIVGVMECMFYVKPIVIVKANVYPIKRIRFDDIEVNVPNKPEIYLTEIFGAGWKKFPKKTITGHYSKNI